MSEDLIRPSVVERPREVLVEVAGPWFGNLDFEAFDALVERLRGDGRRIIVKVDQLDHSCLVVGYIEKLIHGADRAVYVFPATPDAEETLKLLSHPELTLIGSLEDLP